MIFSLWQNPYAERLIGSIRRECLNHLMVFNERQLRRILRELYFAYYNEVRPHQSLERNAPVARAVEPPAKGKIFLSRKLADCIIAICGQHKSDWVNVEPGVAGPMVTDRRRITGACLDELWAKPDRQANRTGAGNCNVDPNKRLYNRLNFRDGQGNGEARPRSSLNAIQY